MGFPKTQSAFFLETILTAGRILQAWSERLMIGDFPTRIVALRGNHEAELLRFLEDDKFSKNGVALGAWRRSRHMELTLKPCCGARDIRRLKQL